MKASVFIQGGKESLM